MNQRALHGLFFLLTAGVASAQTNAPAAGDPRAAPDLEPLLGAWRADHGANWRALTDGDTGYLQMLSGGRTELVHAVRDDAEFVDLARAALRETAAMHGLDVDTLVLERTLHLPLGIIGSSDKMTVRFRQFVDGVRVEDGFVNVLFDMQGRLLSIQTIAIPRLAGFDARPTIRPERAVEKAIEAFQKRTGLVATSATLVESVVDQFHDGETRVPRLAWKVDVRVEADGVESIGDEWYVDARTGEAYRSRPSIHSFDVSGSVTSNATPGLGADWTNNPPTQQPMRFMRVTSGATTTFTDENGNFTLVGVNAPASVTVAYSGTYVNVVNNQGAAYSLTTTLNAATGNVIAMNPTPTEFTNSQANAFRVVPLVRDFIKAINPSDTHADFLATANVNIASACNATWSGSAINFYSAGSGCTNFAFSTIIAHEYGHWLNSLYGTGNGSDGMGEGNADVWALYTFDTPLNGQGAFNGTGFVRTGTTTRQFCGDANPACYGEVHDDGEPWMAAAWKVRTRLNTAYGNTTGDLIANSLFLGWMNGYNQTQIRSVIETQWLALDDDDGNVNNGTPHYASIDQGFRDQGFPGVTLFQVTVDNVNVLTDTTNQTSPYVVNARIIANQNPPLTVKELRYRIDGGAFTAVPMVNTTGDNYTAQIPAQLAPKRIEYYVTATNSAASSNSFPIGAANIPIEFVVGTRRTIGKWTFEAGDAQGWTNGATAGTNEWQRGDPAGKTGTGWADPGSSVSPNNCWATDLGTTTNGSYAANSNTWLRTPILDCTAAIGTKLRFNRWLSVQGSASDQARIRVNGTQVYINPTANLNDGAWSMQTIDIASLADGNPSVQIEWNLQANGTTNYGGWNVDDVEVVWIEDIPDPCPAPTNYCTSTANSTGLPAVMQFQGEGNISLNNLTIITTGCPAFSSGVYFFGPNAIQVPFGNGFRCVGGAVSRFPVQQTNEFGDAVRTLNLNNMPQPVTVGSTWRFQFWYRDVLGGGSGYNLSDGLAVTFCQ